ncbi:hypothetical protein QTO31_11275 [Chloroflexus sp. MS-CIW-1]|uniref:hypothetical protein n=1 Tax=Chloroflexus sp. MS-CIW-1 TaxID=3055768 RepID=UPI00264834DA|nr:hypothetical protein [Chloroflexus sp. MS-CIW-1]MDN5272552.1 hypothetical protein [Chloroflexus sp. MS-CIW-1]
MLQVVRYDRRPEPRAAEIATDPAGWLAREGYEVFSTLVVQAASQSMTIEIYRRDGDDPFVLYHPAFSPGGLRAALYLLPHADAMDELLQRAQQMVATLMTVAAQRRETS